MKRIYLDHAATTPPDKDVIEAVKKAQEDLWGNPSSVHGFGRDAKKVLREAREMVATVLNCQVEEVIFTSGGSESDNLAIRGVVENKIKEFADREIGRKPHVITSQIEHHAVLDVVKDLEKRGVLEASYIAPDKKGIVDAKNVEDAVRENTVLASVMYANNEVGTVQPIREIGKRIEKLNEKREQKIIFHTDAVQAMEYLKIDVDWLHVDLLTFTAHKFYGPKGAGALYKRRGVKLSPQIVGGGQEMRQRAGTENVPAIFGMHNALIKMHKQKTEGDDDEPPVYERDALLVFNESKRLLKLRKKLIDGLLEIEDVKLNGSREERLPNNVNVSFKNAEGESILILLDQKGIAASSGSACTSGSLEPSHVLTAMNVPEEWSHGSIRFTLGRSTTEDEIDRVLQIVPDIVDRLRKMSPIKSS